MAMVWVALWDILKLVFCVSIAMEVCGAYTVNSDTGGVLRSPVYVGCCLHVSLGVLRYALFCLNHI